MAAKGELDILAAAATSLPAEEWSGVTASGDANEEKQLCQMRQTLQRIIQQKDPILSSSKNNSNNNNIDEDGLVVDPSAYVEAMQKAPHLVEQESNPRLFLRREDGNVNTASRRLLSYWTFRRNIYGPERAFLPLRLNEAMEQDDLECLRSGFLAQLPPDKQGRSVICANRARRPKGCTTVAQRANSIFYVLSLAAENPLSQTDGIVILSILSEKTSLNVPNRHIFRDLLLHALPIKVHSLHVACCPPPGSKRMFLEHLIPSAHQAVGGNAVVKSVTSHVGKSPADLVHKLQQHGFARGAIPEALGGTWRYQEWEQQLIQALRGQLNEKKRAPADVGRPSLPPTKQPPRKKRKSEAITAASMASAFPSDDTSTADRKFPELTSHAIKALQEIALPPEALQSGVYSADTIRKLNAVMSSIPAEVFERGDNDEEKADFVRKRNALYSKRKYYKKKLQVESLTISRDGLQAKNSALKEEQHRLEGLIREAQTLALEEETRKSRGVVDGQNPAASLSSLASAAAVRQTLLPPTGGLVEQMMLARNQQFQNALMTSIGGGGWPAAGLAVPPQDYFRAARPMSLTAAAAYGSLPAAATSSHLRMSAAGTTAAAAPTMGSALEEQLMQEQAVLHRLSESRMAAALQQQALQHEATPQDSSWLFRLMEENRRRME